MKITAYLIVSVIMIVFSAPAYSQQFKEIVIGKQIWMTENLNVDRFRNGDLIPESKTPAEWQKAAETKQPAWCYYNNDPKNGLQFGKLYNWYAVSDSRGLTPTGWHLPSDAEYTILTDLFGGDKYGPNTGSKMKSKAGWSKNTDITNESGFSGLPAGGCISNGSFSLLGEAGGWWSATEQTATSAWARQLINNSGYVFRVAGDKGSGLSVRCIKD